MYVLVNSGLIIKLNYYFKYSSKLFLHSKFLVFTFNKFENYYTLFPYVRFAFEWKFSSAYTQRQITVFVTISWIINRLSKSNSYSRPNLEFKMTTLMKTAFRRFNARAHLHFRHVLKCFIIKFTSPFPRKKF